MCDDCNWQELLEEIEEMQAAGGYEFAHHTLSGIYETVEANEALHGEAAGGCA